VGLQNNFKLTSLVQSSIAVFALIPKTFFSLSNNLCVVVRLDEDEKLELGKIIICIGRIQLAMNLTLFVNSCKILISFASSLP